MSIEMKNWIFEISFHRGIYSVQDYASIDAIAADVIPKDVLIAMTAECKDFHSKLLAILRGTSGIISLMSSSIFIWMIMRSHDRLSTTKHRLLLGLCISDILSSMSWSTFNATMPSEYDYFAWNARGNLATSTAQGFLVTLGMYGGLFYNAFLSIYLLALVKYNKSDEFIRVKIEPFLHGLPIAVALGYSMYLLVKQHFNDDGGVIHEPVNALPHCRGYDIGEIREGFEIPCWRGYDHVRMVLISRLVLMFIPVLIMMVCLGMIYSAVRMQENNLARYGIGALRLNLQQQSASTRFNNMRSRSRAVVHKAFGYSFTWLLSYGIYLITYLVRGSVRKSLVLTYINAICLPLQGFFNLLIFMHPKIMAARRSMGRGETVSWRDAFSTAFWSRGRRGGNQGTSRSNRRGRNQGTSRSNRRGRNQGTSRSNRRGRDQAPHRFNLHGRSGRALRNTSNEDAAASNVTLPYPSTETSSARDLNLYADDMVEMRNMNFVEDINGGNALLDFVDNPYADDMVEMRNMNFVEDINGGNALLDIVENPFEDAMARQDEEEGMNKTEMGSEEIMPFTSQCEKNRTYSTLSSMRHIDYF